MPLLLLLSHTSQKPYKLNQDTKYPAACLGRTDQPGLKLKEAMERFCDTQHNFNGAEEAGKRVLISLAAQPVCLPMMSPPHYNEMRGGGDGPYHVSRKKRGWRLNRKSPLFPRIVILVMKDRYKSHNKPGMSFLECPTDPYPV